MMLLFWILIGFGVYYLYTNHEQSPHSHQHQSAEDKLKERYVNGEIDDEMYRQMMKTLKE